MFQLDVMIYDYTYTYGTIHYVKLETEGLMKARQWSLAVVLILVNYIIFATLFTWLLETDFNAVYAPVRRCQPLHRHPPNRL